MLNSRKSATWLKWLQRTCANYLLHCAGARVEYSTWDKYRSWPWDAADTCLEAGVWGACHEWPYENELVSWFGLRNYFSEGLEKYFKSMINFSCVGWLDCWACAVCSAVFCLPCHLESQALSVSPSEEFRQIIVLLFGDLQCCQDTSL